MFVFKRQPFLMDTLISIAHAVGKKKKRERNMVRKKAGSLLHKNYKSLMALFSSHIVAGMASNDLEHLDRNTYKARCPG